MVDIRVLCSYSLSVIMIILLNIKLAYSDKCNSFEDDMVELQDIDGDKFNKTVNGCIERIEFDGKTIVMATIRNQKLPVLGRDSVRNMVQLRGISFLGCELDVLEPLAFRNVPRLKNVQISNCNLEEIPKGVFNTVENLEVLKLDHNQISVIEAQAFGNLSVLRRIYGNHNRLTEWRREWFDNSLRLETMDFQRNKIRAIPPKAFAGMKKLKQICFDYNEIESVGPAAFEGLSDLDHLRLKHNRLKVIKQDVFPVPIRIRYLIISANFLNSLSDELMQKLSVVDILIDYNPWKCACLDRIHSWMFTTNVTLTKAKHCDMSFVPDCAVPKTHPDTCSGDVDDELTERYLGILRNLASPLKEWCAKLD